LADETKELAKAYNIENAELLLLTENYEALLKAIRNYDNEQLKKAKVDTKEAIAAAETDFYNNLPSTKDGGFYFNTTKDEDGLL
jgi:hypothetical protein